METVFNDNIHSKVSRKLLSIRWLNKWGIEKSFIEEKVRSKDFIDNLNYMIFSKDYSCKAAFELCKEIILGLCQLNLSKDEIPEDWIKYIYNYTLHKSFPEAITLDLNPKLNSVCEVYLRVLRVTCDIQKNGGDSSFQSKYPLHFLTNEEAADLESMEEYSKFLKAFKQDYIYEMMKLNYEITGFNTLEHVCGVHYLSLYIARQLKQIGIKVDLGRVSGAAAGHDIGKFGCKVSELKRVPYLHYYYSDQWFKKYGINYIRNIAINHSTWDLELENLSIESLILIYSDFRVKNRKTLKGEEMHIFSLKDSFDVILQKLDNLDDKKEKRYKRVYAKLKDFEDYLMSLNVITEIDETPKVNTIGFINSPNYSIMQGEEVIQHLKYLAISHNINLMHLLRDEYSLDVILETARSEKDWKNLREYIRIFEEYSTYLTQRQKLQTIKFLFENLTHPEDDIRRHSAEIIGTLIALLDEDYRKELPEKVEIEEANINSFELFKEYIELLLFPSHKIISSHRNWLGYSLSILCNSLFTSCKDNQRLNYRKVLLEYFDIQIYKGSDMQLYLLDSAKYIPLEEDEALTPLYQFIISMLSKRNSTLRLAALEVSIILCRKLQNTGYLLSEVKRYLNYVNFKSNIPAENMLRYELASVLMDTELQEKYKNWLNMDEIKLSEIFLSNLKTATEWVKKKHQVSLLLHYVVNNNIGNALHAAIHFCNLLKVSAVESVRHQAGSAILSIMPKLSPSERNEVAIELLRALEIEGHKFTEYIPKYLGQVLLFLAPKELDEIIDDLTYKIKISKPSVKTLILKTVGVMAEYYSNYNRDDEVRYESRLINILGILLNGLGDYNPQVNQAAFGAIGKVIFGSKTLSLEEKMNIFKLIAKKLLTLVAEDHSNELLFLSNAAGLNHIYRFISDYSFFKEGISLPVPEKIAFFPGTFDPYSLSHMEISRRIRNLDFEVYMAVDEFSWSKKTLPNLLRKNILSMSIASELNMFIYPENFPTNIANKEDLKTLKNNFKNSEVYMVVGSDVVINASAYKEKKSKDSIHSFSHIIFERGKAKHLEKAIKNIEGNIEILTLPLKYTDISSTQIRNYIDENRDISSLIDPLAQQYIYDNGFYQREPLDKATLKSVYLETEIINKLDKNLLSLLCKQVDQCDEKLKGNIESVFLKPSGRVILLKDSSTKEILGFSLFHWTRSSMLFEEIREVSVAEYIRENSLGRILLIDGLYIKNIDRNKNLEQILLTETLAFCISRDYEYALFKNSIPKLCSPYFSELLKAYGFQQINYGGYSSNLWLVNMSTPCVINLDLENLIKEPFRSNNKVKSIISSSRLKLQKALCNLFPGQLVLPFDSNMLHQGLIKKICAENEVPSTPIVPRTLGKAMCVPYGDILDRYIIPNTVTKALHTEKYFDTDMKSFSIGEFPHYMNLENQIKMLKSFNKPIILVDNILHKGYRMKALDPLFKEEDLKVQKIIVAILSARGKDLMDYQNRKVESVYFIPRLKIWFNENALYPFIGGDALWRGKFPERNLLPSINLIMPYTSPNFIRGASNTALFDLSKTCIENAIDILTTLESEFHFMNERNLTLSSLGQVFTIPRCPDHGRDIKYDLNLNASHYLRNDLELLNRLENIIRR